jgi:hypothetical protein
MDEREYKHKLSNFLINPLTVLAKRGGSGRISKIGLTHTQIANFSKLKYWGLVEKMGAGAWEITLEGWDFLKNRLQVYDTVHTLNDRRIGFSGNIIMFKDLGNEFWQRNEYVKHSTRIASDEQDQTGDLFR